MLPLNQKRMFTTATNSGYCVLPTQIISQFCQALHHFFALPYQVGQCYGT